MFTSDLIGADLIVVPMRGWRRDMWLDETGLPWVKPSPNIRRLETAIHYPGTVFVEATNLSEARGTDRALEQAGAPWLRARAVADSMNAMGLPGIRFEATRFMSARRAAKYPGQTLPAVRFILTDRESYRPVSTAIRFIALVRRLHPTTFRWQGGAGSIASPHRELAKRSVWRLEGTAKWERRRLSLPGFEGSFFLLSKRFGLNSRIWVDAMPLISGLG